MKTTDQTNCIHPGKATLPKKPQRGRMVLGAMLVAMAQGLLGTGPRAMAADVVFAQARADFASVSAVNNNTTATWDSGLGIPDTYGRSVSMTGCGHWNYYQSDHANPTFGTPELLSWQSIGNAGNAGYGGTAEFAGFMLPSVGASKIFSDSAEPAADQVTWHPYLGGQPYAVLRWTAGAVEGGLLQIKGAIDKTGEGGNGEDSFTIFVNGVLQFSVPSLLNGDSSAFRISLPVSAGQHVDFVLGGISFGANEAKLSATISSTHAAEYTWGGGNLLWSDTSASGWNGGPPVASDIATIPSGTVSFAQHDTFGIDRTTTSATINLNGGTLASAGWFNTIWNLNQNGGTLLCNGGAYPQFPAFQLAGTLTATGSNSINLGSGENNFVNIGGNGNPTLTVIAPNVTDSLTVNVPFQDSRYGPNSLTKTGSGTLTLNAVNAYTGDTTVDGGALAIGENGVFAVGSSFGRASTMVINSGAVVNAGGSGGIVTATYIGGKINNTGAEGVGTLTINGGILNVAAGSATGTYGDCSHVWLNPYGGTGSTINLNSGTLSSARPIANGSGGEAYFNFNGGVLQAADDINLLDNAGTLTVNLMAGGGTIDTNGFFVRVLPSIGGSGSLTKTGTGLLLLTGANSFLGDISVNDGTLVAGAATGGIDPVTSPLGNPSVSRTIAIGAYGTLKFMAHDVLGNAATAPAASVVINGGMVTTDGHLNSFNSLTLSNGGSVTGDNSSGFGYGYNLNGTVYSTGNTTNTMSGANFYLNRITGNTTFDVAIGSTLQVSSPIINSWDNIPAGITKTGDGLLLLTGTNTYAGDTTINNGTLAIQKPYLAAASNIVIAAAGKLTLDFDEALGDVSNTVATLTIGGVAKASGTWGATGSGATHIDNTHFSGVGTLTVTTGPSLTDYDGWIGQFFPGVTDPLVIGDAADPDGDGVSNRAEYAFGLLPNSGTSVNPITVPLDKSAGTFTYTRRDPTLTSINYTVWTSTNLASWTEDPDAKQSAGPTDPNGVQAVVVTLSTLPTAPRFFIQVRAN